ncbi:MAG: lysophospholipid acyltransferase family protein [Candidatus Binatia bacterium]
MTLRRKLRRKVRRFLRRRKDALVYYLARVAVWVPRQMELDTALRMADRVGDVAYIALRGTRRLALEHLDIAFGDQKPRDEKLRIVRGCMRNIARCVVEDAKIAEIRARFADYAEVQGWENWEAIKEATGTGAIVVTGHIGNWELLAAYFAGRGVPIGAIARRLNDPRLNQLLVDFRRANGVQPILRESPNASREMLSILRQSGLLAMLIDQDLKTPSISVPFFGRSARTPLAAAALAVRKEIPVIPAFAQRRPGGGHRFIIMPALYPPAGADRATAVVALTVRINELFEAHIRANPTEWVWWHRRWRRPPVPNLDLDAAIG